MRARLDEARLNFVFVSTCSAPHLSSSQDIATTLQRSRRPLPLSSYIRYQRLEKHGGPSEKNFTKTCILVFPYVFPRLQVDSLFAAGTIVLPLDRPDEHREGQKLQDCFSLVSRMAAETWFSIRIQADFNWLLDRRFIHATWLVAQRDDDGILLIRVYIIPEDLGGMHNLSRLRERARRLRRVLGIVTRDPRAWLGHPVQEVQHNFLADLQTPEVSQS